VPIRNTRRARDDGHDLRRQPSEIVACLLVRDLVQLAQVPDARQPSDLRLRVGGGVSRQPGRFVRLGLGHAGLEALVDEQPPDLLVRDLTDELLDVDAAVPERTAFAIGLGDLGLDRDDALQPRLEVRDLAHLCRTLPDWDSSMV
jgi:hypothetical protein